MATRIGVAREGRFSSWNPREIYESLDYLYIVTRLDSPQTMLIPPDLVPRGRKAKGRGDDRPEHVCRSPRPNSNFAPIVPRRK